MRRNSNLPRGSQNGGSGPLLTNPLHDLDLELELLKRKREMVEQQQHLLGLNFSNQSYQPRLNNQGGFNDNFVQPMQNFNQPRGNQPQSLFSNFNFSNLYDEAPHSFRQHGNFDRQHGTKRQSTIPIWESDSAPKRFSGPQKFSQKPPARRNDTPRRPPPPRNKNQKSSPAPVPPKPTGQRYGSSRYVEPRNRNKDSMGANPRQKNVTKNKIHKPTNSAPNKLNSYPVEQRKALFKQALKSGEPKDQVLLADEEPDKQTIGRLELALGHILKEMKQQYGNSKEYENHFVKMALTRAVKNIIRERLRSAMVGKLVRLYPEVIEIYRVKFPVETDKEILDMASEKVKEEISSRQYLKIVDEVNPEKYFRHNIQRLMKTTLEEMFIKLQEIYVTNGEWKINPNETENSAIKTEDENKENEKEKSTENSIADNTTEDVGNTSVKDGDKDDTQENNVTLDKTGDIVDEKKDDIVEEKKDDIVEEKKDDIVEEKKDGKDAEGTKDFKANNEDDCFTAPENSKIIAFYDNIMNMLLKRRLPYLLPMYKETIVRFLDLKSEYRQTKAAIILGTNQRAEELIDLRKQEANQSNTVANNSKTNKHQRNHPQDAPYFVKIFARPSLPKRPVMQEFLDKFNPKSIKRHKNVHNLLFVGFSNEEDFNNILKEDNCTIGKSSLSIKASDKKKEELIITNVSASEETTEPAEVIEKPAAPENTADISISSDIDNQITDLLTSIEESNERERENSKQNTEEVAEANANGDKANIEEQIDDNAEEALLNEDNLNIDAEIAEVGNVDAKIKEDGYEDANISSQNTLEVAEGANIEKEIEDNVGELKNFDGVMETGRSTPTRASTRLATSTPNTIKTRRASRLAQN